MVIFQRIVMFPCTSLAKIIVIWKINADKVYDSMTPPVWAYQTLSFATRRGIFLQMVVIVTGVSPQKWPKHSGIGISSLLWSWCFHSPKDMAAVAAVDFCWCFDRLQVLKFAWSLGRERHLLAGGVNGRDVRNPWKSSLWSFSTERDDPKGKDAKVVCHHFPWFVSA